MLSKRNLYFLIKNCLSFKNIGRSKKIAFEILNFSSHWNKSTMSRCSLIIIITLIILNSLILLVKYIKYLIYELILGLQ